MPVPGLGQRATLHIAAAYWLNPDGSMHEILIERLETTLAMSKANPDAMIVLTGGVPKNHKTEGKLMANWLISKGVPSRHRDKTDHQHPL